MEIYIVTCITEDDEFCDVKNVAVFGNEADAVAYVNKWQDTSKPWYKRTTYYSIEEWNVA